MELTCGTYRCETTDIPLDQTSLLIPPGDSAAEVKVELPEIPNDAGIGSSPQKSTKFSTSEPVHNNEELYV